RQRNSGEKRRGGSISKQGNQTIRTLLILGGGIAVGAPAAERPLDCGAVGAAPFQGCRGGPGGADGAERVGLARQGGGLSGARAGGGLSCAEEVQEITSSERATRLEGTTVRNLDRGTQCAASASSASG